MGALNIKVKVAQRVFASESGGAERWFRVTGWLDHNTVEIMRDDGTLFEVAEDRAVEVFPNVLVSMGIQADSNDVSMAFQAPRRIHIYREKLGSEMGVAR